MHNLDYDYTQSSLLGNSNYSANICLNRNAPERGHRGEVVRLRMMHRPVGFNVASSGVAGKGGEGRMGRLGRVDRVGKIQDWQVQRYKVTARSPALATVALLEQ